jgi:hypothetical protein
MVEGVKSTLLSTGAIGASCQKQRILEIFSLYERPTFHLEWYLQSDQVFFFFFFFFNFVMYPHWKSSTRGISQIWLQVKEESRKFNTFTAFCQPAGTCCLNMAIKRKTQNLATSVFFFWQKSFYMRCIGFYLFFISGKKFPKEKIAESDPLVIPEIVGN